MTLLRPAIRDWLVRWGESLALAVMVAIGG